MPEDFAANTPSIGAEIARATDVTVPLDDIGGKPGGTVTIRPGITTLVGPNGSGKTRALRSIQAVLRSRDVSATHVRFLPAGRTGPIERYRAATDSPGVGSQHGEAFYGHISYRTQWHDIESVVGDIMNLDQRPDLRIKVETRLQQLFKRGIDFQWSQGGLAMSFTAMSDNARYQSGLEASGITQLVSLLAAIYDDTIKTLIVDEPEISLHPQLQAFILEEMESVAGDWTDPGKKRIVISTHSPSFLPLRSLADLASIVFFGGDADCRQIDPADGLLQSSKLKDFVARTSLSHRQALFAERILLVEGPSDEIIAARTARRLGLKIEARNTQILPALGKSEFREARKLFTKAGMRVTVLADLDALADDNRLVNDFSGAEGATAIANAIGHNSLIELDGNLRSELAGLIAANTATIDAVVGAYPYWSDKQNPDVKRRRCTLAQILTDHSIFTGELGTKMAVLATRYGVLLNGLEQLGCFFLRRGAIENYYADTSDGAGKPARASTEADRLTTLTSTQLTAEYLEMVRALRCAAPGRDVDESVLLRGKLAAALGAIFQSMEPGSTDAQLEAMAISVLPAIEGLFTFHNATNVNQPAVRVELRSKIFSLTGFPLTVARKDNLNEAVGQIQPR
ncbi:ATP-dependent nuclease [Sphingomonas carotinifaciens]|uniref:ATP-dependent nuclease n=1 Tax=Sphingomonas carotinifaciens TaxID=1166323 RepID=UPI001237928B|nr:AAA family ATPase [Sphingomonas carotinifaciens]